MFKKNKIAFLKKIILLYGCVYLTNIVSSSYDIPLIWVTESLATSTVGAKHNLETAESYVKEFIDSLVSIASDKTKSLEEKRSSLIRIIEENVDIQWAGRFVLGKYWRNLTTEQQNDFVNLYRDYLINTYAPYFQSYSGENADVDFVEYIDENDYSVECVFYNKNQEEILINLAVSYNPSEDRFLIRDVNVEGISLLNSQRSDFTSSISNIGYNEFLQQMVNKIENLKANPDGVINNNAGKTSSKSNMTRRATQ